MIRPQRFVATPGTPSSDQREGRGEGPAGETARRRLAAPANPSPCLVPQKRRIEAQRRNGRIAGWGGLLQTRTVVLLLAAMVLAIMPGSLSAQVDSDEAVENGRTALRRGYHRPWYDAEQDAIKRIDVRERAKSRSRGIDAPRLDFLSVLAWVLLGLLLLLAAYLLVLAYLRQENLVAQTQAQAAKRGYDVVDRIEALPFMARRDQTDLLGQARRFYEAGNYAEAIVYLFSYQLVELDRHGILHLARGKTNRQYLHEARPSGLRGLLEQTMVTFEDVFFGARSLDRDGFERCWNRLEEFQATLGGAV